MIDRRTLLLGSIAAAGLGSNAFAQAAHLPAIASFSILADFVAQVAGDRLALGLLIGAGGDAHSYSPTPADSRALAQAQLVFVNGLGFEGWLNRLIRSSGTKATIVTATTGITPIKAAEHDHGRSHAGHNHGEHDPHAWQSVANAKIYVANIRNALVAADPAARAHYETRATAYLATLDSLEAEVRAAIARIPQNRRAIVTSHDAFEYFGQAYGLKFLSPKGLSTAAEPTPRAIANLIRQIRADKITAVFIEAISDPRLMKRIADESGARIGGTLFSDSVSATDGPAPTYVAMIRHNVAQFSQALLA